MAQEKTDQTREPLEGDKVRPNDDVVIYTTKKVQSIYPTIGTPVKLHKVQAAKWIESGKGTPKAPTLTDAPTAGNKSTAKNQKVADVAASADPLVPQGDDDSL